MTIYWLKQKGLALLLLALTLIFAEFMIVNDAAILMLVSVPMGLFLFRTKEMLFKNDYIYVIGDGSRRL